MQGARELSSRPPPPSALPARRSLPGDRRAELRSPGEMADRSSHLDLADERYMVRRALPVAARFQHLMRDEMRGKLWRSPHVIEPSATIIQGPVGRSVTPPGEAALRRRDEPATDVDPIMRLAQP